MIYILHHERVKQKETGWPVASNKCNISTRNNLWFIVYRLSNYRNICASHAQTIRINNLIKWLFCALAFSLF